MILDTNALSALADGDEAILPVLGRIGFLYLPSVVLGEYRYGILQSKNRRDYEGWLKHQIPAFLQLSVDRDTAYFYSNLRLKLKRIGKPIPVNDTWIAALAWQHDLPVVSRDIHFDWVDAIQRISW